MSEFTSADKIESTRVLDVIEVIRGAFRNALMKSEDKPQIGVYRPSLLPLCLKRQFLIYKRGIIISEEKAGLFEIGRLFHNFFSQTIQTIKDGGLTVKAVEAPFNIIILQNDELLRISGKADLIIEVNNEAYIVEVKSIKKLPEAPLKHHTEQLQFYLAGYGLKRGFLVYLEKMFMKHIIFPVDFSLEIFKRLLERASALHKHLISDTPPKPDGESWECRYCEFRDECK